MRKIVIIENNEAFLSELKTAFEKDAEFDICGICGDGSVGISLIERVKPDIVITDIVLPGEDGFGVMKYVREKTPNCAVFVISNFADDGIVTRAISAGARYYFVKPVSALTVYERVKDVMTAKSSQYLVSSESRDRRRVTSIDEKISHIFMIIGVPPHITGYQYLREGIKMTVTEPAIINSVTKKLYPAIAEKFQTSASKVERAIRHAIEVAWNRGRVDAINSVFGIKVYIGTEKPTNSEFIALIADKLIFEDLT